MSVYRASPLPRSVRRIPLFTDPYCLAAQAIVVTDGSSIKSKADLTGKTIAVQTGTTAETYCMEQGYTVNSYAANNDAESALTSGKVDAWVIDDLTAADMVAVYNADNSDSPLVILDEAMTTEPYAFAFAFGSEELVKEINGIIDGLVADGTIAQIFKDNNAPLHLARDKVRGYAGDTRGYAGIRGDTRPFEKRPGENFEIGSFSRAERRDDCEIKVSLADAHGLRLRQFKSFARLFNGPRTKAEPLCMSLELTLQTSRVGAMPRKSAFLLELWNNALRCSREVLRSCGAILPLMTAKKKLHVEIAMRFNVASARTKKKWLRL